VHADASEPRGSQLDASPPLSLTLHAGQWSQHLWIGCSEFSGAGCRGDGECDSSVAGNSVRIEQARTIERKPRHRGSAAETAPESDSTSRPYQMAKVFVTSLTNGLELSRRIGGSSWLGY
jgi:hypothetical protein